jgi:uncharacterized protein
MSFLIYSLLVTRYFPSMPESLCDRCAGLCCRYFALQIDNPKTARHYDDIRWYLMHENVVVYIENKKWFVGILNKCKNLAADNRCGIYHTRPRICRGYSTDNCDYHGAEYGFEVLFTSAEQLEAYARTKLKKSKRTAVKKKSDAAGRRKFELPLV